MAGGGDPWGEGGVGGRAPITAKLVILHTMGKMRMRMAWSMKPFISKLPGARDSSGNHCYFDMYFIMLININ